MTCPIGTCHPVDICGDCRTSIHPGGWHWPSARGETHPARPIVVCSTCDTVAEPVAPDELAVAWQAELDARPVKGQTSWLG